MLPLGPILDPPEHERGNLLIKNVRLPYIGRESGSQLATIVCRRGRVWKIFGVEETLSMGAEIWQEVDGEGGLLIPSLCHPHVHLDKCFILDQCDELVSGDFNEALKVTAKAKQYFPADAEDLYRRGFKLICESVECGVTSMRAHVEVDMTVRMCCLEVGLRLSREWKHVCPIQIAAFAQDPLFASRDDTMPSLNFSFLEEAARKEGVDVVGSAPYVEPTITQSKRNIDLILDLADSIKIHADFHLDYNVDSASEPLIHYVIQSMRKRGWDNTAKTSSGDTRTVTIGHATRLGLFSDKEWRDLKHSISNLPISIIGLPQSDIYMMGRGQPHPPRATLRVTQLARKFGIGIGMGVNNVQNAFTPQGTADPLSLCTLGVAIFQSGTAQDCMVLLESVTCTSKKAIGIRGSGSLIPVLGDAADFVILRNSKSIQQAVMAPSYDRITISAGRIVASRKSIAWTSAITHETKERK